MKSRSRSKENKSVSGSIIIGKPSNQIVQHYTQTWSRKSIQDYTEKKVGTDGLLPPSYCKIVSDEVLSPGRMLGKRDSLAMSSVDIPSGTIRGLLSPYSDASSRINARDLGDSAYRQRLMALTNPGRSDFSVYVFIRELIEIATMFSIPAKSVGSLLGGAYLNYKFGWLTFLKDLRTLDGIVKTVHSRLRELKSIAEHGGVDRSITLDVISADHTRVNYIIDSVTGTVIRGDVDYTSKRKVYGNIRWQATPQMYEMLQYLEPFEMWDQAVRLVFGLDSKPSVQDVWNMIPFSWLVDYFIDLNSLLGARAHEGLFWPTEASIVRVDTHEWLATPTNQGSWFTVAPSSLRRTEYERKIVTHNDFSLSISFDLSRSQLVTLAALLLKFKG